MAIVLQPGKTPGSVEVRAIFDAWCGFIRTRWRKTRITFRGDGHYAPAGGDDVVRAQRHRLHLRSPGTKPLAKKVDEVADDIRTATPSRTWLFCAAIPRRVTRQVLGLRTANRRPHRGDDARPRHPLRRHQPRCRLGRVDLRQSVLCVRPSRKPDQVCIRHSSPPVAPAAVRPPPIKSAPFSTPPLGRY